MTKTPPRMIHPAAPKSGTVFSAKRYHQRFAKPWIATSTQRLSFQLTSTHAAKAPNAVNVTATISVPRTRSSPVRSEEHTSELQSRLHLVCRLLLEKKKKKKA